MISEKVHLFIIVYMQSLSCFHLPSSVDQPVGSLLPVNDFQKEDTPGVATSKWRVLWDAETQNRSGLISLLFLWENGRISRNPWYFDVFCLSSKFHGFSTSCSHISPINFPSYAKFNLADDLQEFHRMRLKRRDPMFLTMATLLEAGVSKVMGHHQSSWWGNIYTKSWSCLMT